MLHNFHMRLAVFAVNNFNREIFDSVFVSHHGNRERCRETKCPAQNWHIPGHNFSLEDPRARVKIRNKGSTNKTSSPIKKLAAKETNQFFILESPYSNYHVGVLDEFEGVVEADYFGGRMLPVTVDC